MSSKKQESNSRHSSDENSEVEDNDQPDLPSTPNAPPNSTFAESFNATMVPSTANSHISNSIRLGFNQGQNTLQQPHYMTDFQCTLFSLNVSIAYSEMTGISPDEAFDLLYCPIWNSLYTYGVDPQFMNFNQGGGLIQGPDQIYSSNHQSYNTVPNIGGFSSRNSSPVGSSSSSYREVSPTNSQNKINCDYPGCNGSYGRNQEYKRHCEAAHGKKKHQCKFCGRLFGRIDILRNHQDVNNDDYDQNFGGSHRQCKGQKK